MLAAWSAPADALAPVPFRTVAQDDGSASAIHEARSWTIRSERRWRRIWGRLTRGERPSPPLPKIDFARQMLIVVTQGRRPSGGHRVEIDRIRRTDGAWRVEVDEVEPGSDCVTTAVITAPYHVVRVKRSRSHVSVTRERTTISCG